MTNSGFLAVGDLQHYSMFWQLATQYTIAVLSFLSVLMFCYVDRYAFEQWHDKLLRVEGTRLMSTGKLMGRIGRIVYCLALANQFSFGTSTLEGRIFVLVGVAWVLLGAVWTAQDEWRRRHGK